MAVNVPLVHISDLTETTSAADTDCMVIGGADAKKIKWSTIFALVKAKLGSAATQAVANNLTTTSSGSVLDARQGVTLKNSIDTANTAITAINNTLNQLVILVTASGPSITVNANGQASQVVDFSTKIPSGYVLVHAYIWYMGNAAILNYTNAYNQGTNKVNFSFRNEKSSAVTMTPTYGLICIKTSAFSNKAT